MSQQQYLNTAIIHLETDNIISLYKQKQIHLTNFYNALREQQAIPSSNLQDLQIIAEKVSKEGELVKKIEDQLYQMGLPTNPKELQNIYSSIGQAIQTLKDAKAISKWIQSHFPKEYQQQLKLLDSTEHKLNPLCTGEWKGTWTSQKLNVQGELIMALCQVDETILGSGAFAESIFYKAYIEGQINGTTLNIQLFTDYMDGICSAIGMLTTVNSTPTIRGTYDIVDYDYGIFEVKKRPVEFETPTIAESEEEEQRFFSIDLEDLKKRIVEDTPSSKLNKASIDLLDEISKVETIGKVDVQAAIAKARTVLELIVTELYTHHIKGKTSDKLAWKIQALHKKGVFPERIYTYFETVRRVGNLGAHYQPQKLEQVTIFDVKLIGIITALITEWYISAP